MALLAVAAGAALWITLGGQPRTGTPAGYEFVTDIDNWQRTGRETAVITPYNFNLSADLKALPVRIGEWEGTEVPQTNLEVFILLEPEQYVQRLYTRPDGKSIWLSLIGSRKSRSFHSPQICYDTDGWQTVSGSEAISLKTGEIHALRLVATKTSQSTTAQHAVMYFYLWPGYGRDPQDGMVLVKLTAPIYESVEATLELEKAFFRQLFVAARK